jgi:hypothetical protein
MHIHTSTGFDLSLQPVCVQPVRKSGMTYKFQFIPNRQYPAQLLETIVGKDERFCFEYFLCSSGFVNIKCSKPLTFRTDQPEWSSGYSIEKGGKEVVLISGTLINKSISEAVSALQPISREFYLGKFSFKPKVAAFNMQLVGDDAIVPRVFAFIWKCSSRDYETLETFMTRWKHPTNVAIWGGCQFWVVGHTNVRGAESGKPDFRYFIREDEFLSRWNTLIPWLGDDSHVVCDYVPESGVFA